MEKKVRKITMNSNLGITYFLQVSWKEDLGNGFAITLSNGHSAWIGEVSDNDVSKEASDMEMDKITYVDELKKAMILTATPSNKYTFDLIKDEERSEQYIFSYEKKLKEVSFKIGSLKVRNVNNPAEVINELIEHCLNCATELQINNEHLQKENERLRCDWNDMHEKLNKYVSGKEELEQELYTRFTCVLNKKKEKIRNLKEKLSESQQRETQQKIQQKSQDSVPFDTVPISELKDEEYGGSTDEEVKSQKTTLQPAPSLKRQSVASSFDDSPDIAPSRKGRQRGQKRSYTEVKVKTQDPENQEMQRSNPSTSKTTGKNPSSERATVHKSKNTPDPDDLFSDF